MRNSSAAGSDAHARAAKIRGPATVAAPVWPTAGWWHAFGSPELSNLITLAQADNRDLAAAAARLREARAEVMIQRAALFPQVDLEGEAIRAGVGTAAVQTGSQHVSTGNAFGLNLDGSYDLDVWGLERDNLRSATEALKSSHFAQQAAALTVLAAVADGYFNVLALREQISIAQEDITAIEGILGTIKLKVSAGTASHLDLAQEEAQLESVRAELPALEELELEARVALAVLLGRPPESFDVQARNCDGIRLPAVAVGLPAQLLLRRPDVAEAEANLAAAHASLQAARAAFLPQIALGGSDGFGSTAVNTLLHGPSALWDAGAQLVQTIFAGGKLVGQKDLAYATQEELVADYQAAVLNAYADVETALGQVTTTHAKKSTSGARSTRRARRSGSRNCSTARESPICSTSCRRSRRFSGRRTSWPKPGRPPAGPGPPLRGARRRLAGALARAHAVVDGEVRVGLCSAITW